MKGFIAGLLLWTGIVSAAPPDPVTLGNRLELGDVSQARAWLREGMHPDMLADRIGTGLMIAAWRGDIDMMALFLAAGADIHKTNAAGETALMHAAWRGQREAVEWLLARGARVNAGHGRWSALHYAAFAGHQEIVQLLLARGADINARAPNGSTPLMMASYEGHPDVVRELLSRGADTSIKNDHGDGALEWAVKFGHSQIARMVGSSRDLPVASTNRAPAQPPLRSLPPPAQAPAASQLDELVKMRELLASRGMTQSVERIDRRIAALRARQAKEASQQQLIFEITARRAAPTEQESRLYFSRPSVGR